MCPRRSLHYRQIKYRRFMTMTTETITPQMNNWSENNPLINIGGLIMEYLNSALSFLIKCQLSHDG